MKVAAIVLAAGKSSRMGENKLLLQVGERTVLEHIIEKLRQFETVIVTGHNSDVIEEIAKRMGVKTAHNIHYEGGMSTSFQFGLRNIDAEAVFLVLGDIFGFREELLRRMIEKFEDNPNALLVSPIHKGKKGHPVLIRNKLFEEFMEIGENETMKTVIDRHVDRHVFIEADEWTIMDLDTKKDYNTIKRMWKQRNGGFTNHAYSG
jgi:molybdenum cofactor cytidylyltransferase